MQRFHYICLILLREKKIKIIAFAKQPVEETDQISKHTGKLK